MSKKIIYLVTSAASILAAAIVRQDNNETVVEASITGKELDPVKEWDKIHKNDLRPAKVPVAVHLLDSSLTDEEKEAGANLATAIEHYAYDVNNTDHFNTLSRVLNNDYADLEAKGVIINEAANHKQNLQEIYGSEVPETSNLSDNEK